jgi:hypothetical protein
MLLGKHLNMKPLLTLILSVLIFANTSIALAQQSPLDSFIKPERNPDGTIVSGSGFVPCSGADCSPCDLVVMFNTILKWVMLMVFLIFAIIAVKAGINMVVKGTPSELSAAKKSFVNAFIGLFIILAAWLMVDTLLRGVIGKDKVLTDGVIEGYGPWSKVSCATQVKPIIDEGFYKGDAVYVPGNPMSTYTGPAYTGGPLPLCTNQYCSVSALKAAGFNDSQARVMSCIAMTESSGNPSTPPYNQTHPNHRPISTACGLFQITQSTWNAVASGSCDSFSMCMNARCNTENAVKLVRRSGYTPWTCTNCNNKASACVRQYQ